MTVSATLYADVLFRQRLPRSSWHNAQRVGGAQAVAQKRFDKTRKEPVTSEGTHASETYCRCVGTGL